MNTTKKINVNYSSLVGLKAELFRKQTEVNEAKLKAEITRTIPKLKKKNKKTKEENTNENLERVQDADDIKAHKKSKIMLEAKARIYECLKKSKNNSSEYLVDFINKSDESEVEFTDEKEESVNDMTLENEDDWVEYEDCFGRTRKCLREDLPFMQEKDNLIKEQVMNRNEDLKSKSNIEQNYVIEEKEPEIEMMRRKWEEQTQKLADKSNIHYQDILFDEARTHGVGYYAFSQNEEDRIKQQENLFNLRKQTEKKQKEMKELKELRDRMEQNRLKAARIRQRIRAGLPAEIEEEPVQQNNSVPSLSTPQDTPDVNIVKDVPTESTKNDESAKKSNEEDKIVIKEDKIKALGELLGKRTHWHEMSQEEWIHKCRKTRINEFGPTYDGFVSSGYLNSRNSNLETTRNENDKIYSNATEIESIVQNKTDKSHTSQTACNLIKTDSNEFGKSNDEKGNNQNSSSYSPTSISHTTDVNNEQNQNINITSGKINEASIAAGLRYLREKFDKKNS